MQRERSDDLIVTSVPLLFSMSSKLMSPRTYSTFGYCWWPPFSTI